MSDDEHRTSSETGHRKEVLSSEIRYAIEQTAKAAASNCKCAFNKGQQDTLKHVDGMCGDLGGGDGKASLGIEKIRETTKYVDTVMSYEKDAKKYAWRAGVLALLTWIGYAIWNAFKSGVNK